MADTKISGLDALTGANLAATDLVDVVDVSDTTMAASGTNKRMTLTEFGDGLVMQQLVAEYEAAEVVCKTAADLTGSLSSSVVYKIDGAIDMGSTSILVPEGGLSLRGGGYNVSSLYSDTASAVLFAVDGAGTYSGDLILNEMTVYVTAASAQVFDLDNNGNGSAIELNTVNVGKFGASGTETTSVGELDAYRQFRTSDVAFIRVEDGLTFSGTWSGGFAIRDTILLSIPASTTLFKEGTTLDFQGSSISNLNAVSVDDTCTIFDFDDANFSRDEGFALDGARFNLADAHDPIPNMTEASTRRFFKDCSGVRNTFSGGSWEITTEALTTISTASVAVKIAGTTTYSDLVYFSQTVSNAFVFDSTVMKDYKISGQIIVDGGANDEIAVIIRRYDASAAAYGTDVRTFTRQVQNLIGGLDVAYFTIGANVQDLDEDDRIELWVANNTDTSNVTILEGSYIDLSVRLG